MSRTVRPARHCLRVGTVREVAATVDPPLCLDGVPDELLEIPVYLNPRLRSRFGLARRSAQTDLSWIELYSGCIAHGEAFRDTLGHELAHFVAGFANRHGPVWRLWAQRIGVKPEACGSQEESRRVGLPGIPKPYRYPCNKCDAVLERARPLRAARVYLHRGCGGRFNPSGSGP